MKKILFFIVPVCMVILSVCGCSTGKVQVPDVINTDVETAKDVLASNGLIPVVKYIYSEDVEKETVIELDPQVHEPVDKHSKISVYISKGPQTITAENAHGEWVHIGTNEDDWQFDRPFIQKGILYIDCYKVVFGTAMQWKDNYQEGNAYGLASVNDSFDDAVPIKINYEKQRWNAFEEQGFVLEVPLGDLGVDKPTDLYFRLAADNNGIHKDILVNFSITW